MLVIELEITRDQMIVARGNVNDLVIGDPFVRDGRKHIYRHQEQQAGTYRLRLVCANELFERFDLTPERAGVPARIGFVSQAG